MRHVLWISLLAIGIVGCETPTKLGVVVDTFDLTRQTQNIAPTIPLRRPDGKITTIEEAAGPFYVIAFVDAPAGKPCALVPEVQTLARALWLESISVVQITEPTKAQPIPDDILKICPPPEKNLILVFDPKTLARQMFLQPKRGTVYLIDRHGYIDTVGSLTDTKQVLYRANLLAKEWDQEKFDEMFDGDLDARD